MRTFDKAAIPVDAQLDLLAKRGLSIQDRKRAKKFLEVVSYFRLSAYMRPFQTHGHAFVAGHASSRSHSCMSSTSGYGCW
ncbi:hypothetical protein [Xanthomonas oryzae]|uniref:hypothetical protein n=1 Tax=Xanthomonas oryzae TaxID=347 RepID=UPI000AEAB961|nr:hypothetical protein [Xanthomonas oryzae]